MLQIGDQLNSYTIAAGEPWIMSVQMKAMVGSAIINWSARRLVLTFYSADRAQVAQIEGVYTSDATGAFFAFIRDGRFSEGLFGQALQVELAERLLNGRAVIATGALSVVPTASGLLTFGSIIGRIDARFTLYFNAVGMIELVEQDLLPYGGVPVTPGPVITTPAAISSDGTPQVGETFTGVDPVGNGPVVARRWLFGGTTVAATQTYTGTAAGALRFEGDVQGPDGTILTSGSTITVAAAPVTLGTIALSGALKLGVTSNGTITGATSGSTITDTLPGLTINSAARTYSFDGTGTAGSFANALIETLAGATNSGRESAVTIAAASSAFTMTQLAASNRTYQRATTTGGGQSKGTGTIPVAINVNTPGSVFARIRSEADGSILQAAFALTSTTVTGAQTINVPGVDARTGWFYVDLAPSATGPWQDGTVRVGMGRLIGISGQSQAVRQIAKMPSYAGTNASLGVTISPNASVYARYTDDQRSLTTPVWSLPADGGNYDSTFAAEFLRLQVAAFGVNCGIVGHAVGATNIASWQPGQANFTNLAAVLDAVGGFEAFHEHIGGNDAGENTSYADFQTRLGAFFSGVAGRNAIRGTNFQKVVTTMATRTGGGAGTIASITNIRKAGKDWAAANGAIYSEPHTIVLEDAVHQGQPGGITLARSLHRATTTNDIGPAIASGTRVGVSITMPMTMQAGAAPLVRAGNPVSRFSVFASGTMTSALALSSITVNASSIVLTLAADPGNAAALDVYALLHPDPSGSAAAADMIYDSRVDGDGITTGRALMPSLTPIAIAAPGGGTPTPTPTPTPSARTAKMMFRETLNTDVIAGYNRINLKTADNVPNANANISKALLDTAGQATGLTVDFSNVQGINDVGQTPGDGTLPDAVLQKSFFNGASPAGATNGNVAIPSTTVTISGATVGREYTLRALSSRAIDESRPTRYTASGKAAQDLQAARNIKNFVTIGAGPILPNSSGVLSFTFEPALGSSSYAYLNYLEVSWAE